MIDPTNITNYNLTQNELEEHILFWICAAGKKATTAARTLELFLSKITYNNISPFQAIRNSESNITDLMRESGIGCYTHKSRTFCEIARKKFNLRTCTTENLEQVYGIGMKTSRCFIIHSRKNAPYAGLDTHMLKNLRAHKIKNVPVSTPSNKKTYKLLELEVLKLSKEANLSPAEYDLNVWNKYSVNKNIK